MAQAPWLSTEGFDSRTILVGLGGIGSWAMLALSKMGIQVTGYDFDKVEAHNIGGQVYGPSQDGMSKSTAIMNVCSMLSDDYLTKSYNSRIVGFTSSMHGKVVALAVDNMDARKQLFDSWKLSTIPYFVDVRMSSEVIQGYVVERTPDSIARYEQSLFNDEDVEDEDCTFKATTYCGMMAGAMLASAVANIMFDRPLPDPVGIHLPSWLEIPVDPP
jgi:hypothetical protein